MSLIPSFLLKQLYTRKSLKRDSLGFSFHIKNRLKDARLVEVKGIRINQEPIALDKVYVLDQDQQKIDAEDVNRGQVLDFPLRKGLTIFIEDKGQIMESKRYQVEISFKSSPFGWLDLKFEDTPAEPQEEVNAIPRDEENDYKREVIEKRRRFVADFTGTVPEQITRSTLNPQQMEGNCENFMGFAQIPLGIVGPLFVKGEHAEGEFLIPMATTEGSLVASYNRGIKVLNACGGVKCTVQDDAMQRAPCFVFEDARETLKFRQWLQENLEEIRKQAQASSAHAKLMDVETYLTGKFVYCRFNYQTGDAAGQNMVTLATFMACNWIVQAYPPVQKWVLESNMAADKKPSQLNILHSRGKRVTAEAVLKREVLQNQFGASPEQLNYFKRIGEMGTFMAGGLNNSLHVANALAALFIATGQDVANVAESCVGVGYSEVLPEGDLYVSLTLPSLIVGTYGGGTGLPTQKECLEMMQCYGEGKVYKFAEIVAGVALAGELSLGLAVVSLDWVSSHERLGRNR